MLRSTFALRGGIEELRVYREREDPHNPGNLCYVHIWHGPPTDNGELGPPFAAYLFARIGNHYYQIRLDTGEHTILTEDPRVERIFTKPEPTVACSDFMTFASGNNGDVAPYANNLAAIERSNSIILQAIFYGRRE